MSIRRVRGFGLVALGLAGGVLLSLGITAAAQRGEPLPLKELQQFANVFAAIKSSYVEPLTDEKLINDAIKGLFNDLDPHSSYLDAEAFKEMETLTQGGFGGLGIELGTEEGMPKVIAPIEDTPAARAGIMAGDIITHIDDKPTKDMTLNGAIKLMRGEPNTPIVLTIRRQTADKPLTIHIVRDMIKVRSVRSKLLPDDIAYVRISQFQDRTVSDLAKHLHDLNINGKQPKALILDLRNDPGGLFDGAIGVSSVFLPPDSLVVSTKGRLPSSNREYMSRSAKTLHIDAASNAAAARTVSSWARSVPMVVLVNVGSASSSEIVAGALQDHKRATIIGNRTFGKGSVQSVLPLSEDSGIKITTARYYTPNGRSIQVTGVEPDVLVDDTPQGNLFRLPREGDLSRHLMNGAEDEKLNSADPDELIATEFEMFEFGGTGDYQLQQAINHLEGKPVQRRDPEAVRLAQEAAEKNKQQEKAEKKTPVTSPEGGATRYRITPEGIVKAQ